MWLLSKRKRDTIEISKVHMWTMAVQKVASWAKSHEEFIEKYDRSVEYQLLYSRELVIKLEIMRREIFEPDSRVGREGYDGKAWPAFGPDSVDYQRCYTNHTLHDLFAIPELGLQICLVCQRWFDMDGNACVPWETEEQRELGEKLDKR